MGRLFRKPLLLLALLLGACAGPLPQPPPTLGAALRLEAEADKDAPLRQRTDHLEEALRLYSLIDQRPGQLRCQLKLVRLYQGMGQGAPAQAHLDHALGLAEDLGQKMFLYRAHLLAAQLGRGQEHFQQALEFAPGPLEKAVALTYLGDPLHAHELLAQNPESVDRAADEAAFVFHAYARKTHDLAAALDTLHLYKQADSHAGIFSTLLLIGQLYQEQGDETAAFGARQRALRTALAMGDPKRIRQARTALGSPLDSP